MSVNVYSVAIPYVPPAVTHFNFSASVEGLSFVLDFWYYQDRWNVFVILPNGVIREAVLYPNVWNWSRFNDYMLAGITDRVSIDSSALKYVDLQLAVIT